MKENTRRDFLKKSVLAVSSLALVNTYNIYAKPHLKLSFSTLGCPKWSFREIVEFASKNYYSGIEIRGVLGEMDLTKCVDFNKANILESIQLLKDHDIKVVGLGSSANMHLKDPSARKSNLDEGKRYIDLAEQLNCKSVRVFPNKFLKEISKEECMDLMSNGLLYLSDYAKPTGVDVLLESHGDLVWTKDIKTVLNNVNRQNVALIWDVFNMWIKTQESPIDVYSSLKKYIRHVHLKDGFLLNGKVNYTLFGDGKVPVVEAVKLLRTAGYKGYYGFEWEKMWHPGIQEPEISFPHFVKQMALI